MIPCICDGRGWYRTDDGRIVCEGHGEVVALRPWTPEKVSNWFMWGSVSMAVAFWIVTWSISQ
jgi:hypothetical protein